MSDQFYIAGLPRSGSTLLCNILAQRGDSFVTPTSPLVGIVQTLRDNWRAWHRTVPTMDGDDRLRECLKNIITQYHCVDAPVVFDKNRQWAGMIDTLEFALGRKVKVVLTVRPVHDVLSSMERLWLKNRASGRIPTQLSNDPKMATMELRVQSWLGPKNVVGAPLTWLQDLKRMGFEDRVHIVSFTKLTWHPEETLNEVADFLEIPRFKHDFKNVEQVTHEDDELHGYTGLHSIRKEVKPVDSKANEYLGDEMMKQLYAADGWWMKEPYDFVLSQY